MKNEENTRSGEGVTKEPAEREVNICITARRVGSRLVLKRGGRRGREIWIENSATKTILRDRWFLSEGGWKDIGREEFIDGLLKEQDAIQRAVGMLASMGEHAKLEKMLEELK